MIDIRLAVEDNPPPGDMPIKVTCLNAVAHKRGDKTPAMAVYPDHLHCFACGFHYNEPLGALRLLLGTKEIDATRYTVEALDAYRERATQLATAEPLAAAHAQLFLLQLYNRYLPRLGWLYERGLKDYTIIAFQLGHNGQAFTIPVYDADGKLLSFRYRADPSLNSEDHLERFRYTGMKGRNGLYLYPAPQFAADERDWVMLCEGELDALRLWQEDIPAVTLTNGARQMKKLPALLPARIKQVFIAADQDEAGEIAATETIEACDRLGLKWCRLRWPDGKDVTEAYLKGWRFEHVVRRDNEGNAPCTATEVSLGPRRYLDEPYPGACLGGELEP